MQSPGEQKKSRAKVHSTQKKHSPHNKVGTCYFIIMLATCTFFQPGLSPPKTSLLNQLNNDTWRIQWAEVCTAPVLQFPGRSGWRTCGLHLPVVSCGHISGYVDATRGLGWREAMSGGCLQGPGDIGAKCSDHLPGGSSSGSMNVPGGTAEGQPGGSGSSSVGATATMPGRSTGKVTGGSGMHAAGL